MNQKLMKIVCAGLAAGALGACHRDRKILEGHYDLATTREGKLPLVLEQDSACVHTLMSGSADFNPDSTYHSTFRIATDCVPKARTFQDPGVKQGSYQMLGDTAIMFNDKHVFTGRAYHRSNNDTIVVESTHRLLIYVRK